MKKNKIYLFLSITLLFSACGVDIPMEDELYFKQIYLVRSSTEEALIKEVHFANTESEVVVAVAAGGSLNVEKDVVVTFTENEEAITNYNRKKKSYLEIQYQHLPKNLYRYPSDKTTIKAGDVYGTYSIIVNPAPLHCDSLYLIPLQIEAVSEYQLTEKNIPLLVEIKLINDYSGEYEMVGRLENKTNETIVGYKLFRELTAVDKNTVRLFHQAVENVDNIPSSTFTITIHDDNSLTMATWDEFNLTDGGGSYDPETKSFDLWYEFLNGDALYRVEGLMTINSGEEEE